LSVESGAQLDSGSSSPLNSTPGLESSTVSNLTPNGTTDGKQSLTRFQLKGNNKKMCPKKGHFLLTNDGRVSK